MVGLLGVRVGCGQLRLAPGRRGFGERRRPDGRMFEGVKYASLKGECSMKGRFLPSRE